MGQYDNMLMAFMELPDELPDDIDAIVQYNDGVNFQLVLRSPHSPTKTTWTRTSSRLGNTPTKMVFAMGKKPAIVSMW